MRSPYLYLLVVAPTLTACVPTPPAAPVPHAAVDVNASFGHTWDAVIDEFATRNIPIRTIERASGIIATDRMAVASDLSDAADCGKDWAGARLGPTNATYNVLVRGDSARSSILVTASWFRTGPSREFGKNGNTVTEDCATRSTWETALEQVAKKNAEAKLSSSR